MERNQIRKAKNHSKGVMKMNKPECKEVGRQCEFGETITSQSDVRQEYDQVETGRIGYDSIMSRVPTGRYYRRIEEYRMCKYCQKKEMVNSYQKFV